MKQKSQKEIELEAYELQEYEGEVAAKANQAFAKAEGSKMSFELIKNSIELANQAHRPVLDTLTTITSVIPPLKLAVTGVVGIWEIIHAIFLDKESSKLTRGARVGMSLGLIALGIAALAAPPVAGVLLVAGAGIALGKELLNLGTSVSNYLHVRREYKQATDPIIKQALKEKMHEKRNAVIEKGFDVALAVTSIIGFALLVTPLAPIGAGLLIGSAAVGIGVKAGPTIVKKLTVGLNKFKSFIKKKYFKGEGNSENPLDLSEKEKKGEKNAFSKKYHETTTVMSKELSSGDVLDEIEIGKKEAEFTETYRENPSSSKEIFKKSIKKAQEQPLNKKENKKEEKKDPLKDKSSIDESP